MIWPFVVSAVLREYLAVVFDHGTSGSYVDEHGRPVQEETTFNYLSGSVALPWVFGNNDFYVM